MVIDGYLKNGIFTPIVPIAGNNSRQKAKLIVKENTARQYQRKKTRYYGKKLLFPVFDDSLYNGEQERLLLRMPENVIVHGFDAEIEAQIKGNI